MSVQELFSLTGKTAVLTGATRGLGAAMAVALAEAGANIISIQRKASDTATKSAVEAVGRRCDIFTCELSDRDGLSKIIPTITASHKIDILVNCGGIVTRGSASDQTLEQYDELMQINVTASWMLCQAVGRYWLKEGMKGKIVNLSSIAGHLGSVDQAPYSMSKGAIELLTKSLSNEWAGKGINVNALAPGYCLTDINTDIVESADDEFKRSLNGRIPAERWGKPEDFKGPIVFLCSNASDWVHGESLVVDGGHLGR